MSVRRLLLLAAAILAGAQPAQFSTDVRGFISVDTPIVALTNVRVIDGTGGPVKKGQKSPCRCFKAKQEPSLNT